MHLAAFQYQSKEYVGQVSPDLSSVRPFELSVERAQDGVLPLIQMLSQGNALPHLTAESVPLEKIHLKAPIPRPFRNVWCVGRNYHAHAKELQVSVFKGNNSDPNAWPIVFSKVPQCVVGPFDPVVLPRGDISTQIDYEAELAVVMSKQGKNIPKDKAMDHVFGYTVINDVTARDIQMRHQQWDMGKSFDTFCPMGPWIVTADELEGRKARICCWVNGEKRQEASSELMIFDIPTLIETISRGITLFPGDIIATGTPAGVGMGFQPPKYLSDGDVVRIEVDGLGRIENKFLANVCSA